MVKTVLISSRKNNIKISVQLYSSNAFQHTRNCTCALLALYVPTPPPPHRQCWNCQGTIPLIFQHCIGWGGGRRHGFVKRQHCFLRLRTCETHKIEVVFWLSQGLLSMIVASVPYIQWKGSQMRCTCLHRCNHCLWCVASPGHQIFGLITLCVVGVS